MYSVPTVFVGLMIQMYNGVECYITRQSCGSHANFTIVLARGFCDSIAYLKKFDDVTVKQCAIACVTNHLCEGFYLIDNRICYLVRQEQDTNCKRKNEQQSKFYTTDKMTTNHGPICRQNKPCGFQHCIDSCLEPGFTCVQKYIEVAKQGIASADDVIDSNNINDGNLESFSVTSYYFTLKFTDTFQFSFFVITLKPDGRMTLIIHVGRGSNYVGCNKFEVGADDVNIVTRQVFCKNGKLARQPSIIMGDTIKILQGSKSQSQIFLCEVQAYTSS